MELIIKPTGACNFACTFCSASNTPIKNEYLFKVPEKLKDLINTIKPNGIIVTGGDPLLVDPSYYYDLYDIAKCNISLTTNLKDFYYNPDKWIPLFKEDWINIGTSFQYGSGRKWNKDTIYTEEKFIEIFKLFKKYVNKKLCFIATIDYDNEDTVLQLCELAKKLNTFVKINNVLDQGSQQTSYPRYKLFQAYIKIFENGYDKYEAICSDLEFQGCGLNTNFLCHAIIRSAYINNNGDLIYMSCDDESRESFNLIEDYKNDNIPLIPEYPSIKNHVNKNCWKCELYALCNGCVSQRVRYPEEHCEEMLKIKDKLIYYGFAKKGIV